MSGAEQQDEQKWTYGVRVVSNVIDRAKWRNTLTYRFHPRFTAGVEYNPLAGKVSPLRRYFLGILKVNNIVKAENRNLYCDNF